jgi:hypothetical protein
MEEEIVSRRDSGRLEGAGFPGGAGDARVRHPRLHAHGSDRALFFLFREGDFRSGGADRKGSHLPAGHARLAPAPHRVPCRRQSPCKMPENGTNVKVVLRPGRRRRAAEGRDRIVRAAESAGGGMTPALPAMTVHPMARTEEVLPIISAMYVFMGPSRQRGSHRHFSHGGSRQG